MSEMVEIPLELKNRELLNSLLYQLAIKFPEFQFTLNQNATALLHNCLDLSVQDLIHQHILNFEASNLRMGNRLNAKIFWNSEEINSALPRLREIVPPESSYERHPGLWSHFDEIAAISGILSRAFEDLAVRFGAKSIHLPRLISKAALLKTGHLPKESHQIAFLSVPEKEDHEYALTPAVCLPCFAALENRNLGHQTLTLEGIVHRYEGGVFSKNSLFRLREFRVRELISFGSEEQLRRLQDFFLITC